jgi:hypothetical protein
MELIANSIIPNALGVATAEIITLPVCTVKTNFQTNNHNSIKYTINQIYKNHGIRGFFEAKFSALASQTISTTSKYYFYNLIKKYRKTDSNDILNNSINGMLGGILGSILSHPIDIVKVEQQMQTNLSDIIKNIKQNKLKYLYRGFSQSLLKNILLYSSMYPIYDFYKTKFDNPFISAPLTTITITTFLQPIDYIKTNIMAGNKITVGNNPDFKLTSLYKGFTLNLARSVPHFLITMSVMEYIIAKVSIDKIN